MSLNDTMTPWYVMFEQPPPPPLDLETLRNHFRNVYKLKDEQVEFMIRSASQSLQTALASAEQALASDNLCAALSPVAHSFKGLFLNMGESEWASLARAMEQATKAGQLHEYAAVVQKIRQGVSIVI
ncbi:MAG: Hpt domain-containing protein [Desulfoprunum sp.]|nr:Hpt domain-containing protein [Desulfoprunum sp.]